jgi:DHA1 family bicyclomycin/chloramphenicol resistance-like MFS transporter
MRLLPHSFALAALLTALVAIAPLSTDMYLPAMPTLAVYFGASTAQVQLTLSVYLVGFACAQLILGPLSDRFGRRPVLIGGIFLFTVASVACAMAGSISVLILARFVQAIGACAGAAVGRAVVRDIHDTKDAARLLAHMGTAMATAPLVAPLIGGQLTTRFGWQTNFIALMIIGIVLLGLTVLRLPETIRHANPSALSPQRMAPQRMISNYWALLKNASFQRFALANAFSFAGLFAFISGSSFVLITRFAMTPETFGFAFGVVVMGYMMGAQAAARLLKFMTFERLIGIGGRIGLIAGGAGVLMAAFVPATIPSVIAPIFFYAFSVGFIMPNSMAGAIGPFPHMAGTASALLGFTQMALSALMGLMVGVLFDGTQMPMMAVICTTGTLAWLFSQRIEHSATQNQSASSVSKD